MNIFQVIVPRILEQKNIIKNKIKHLNNCGREFFLILISLILIYFTFKGTILLASFLNSPIYLLNSIFLMFFILILFSGAIISINEFFISYDLNLFLSSPISNINFYIGKIVITIFSATWMPLCLLIPSLIAIGVYYQQGVFYYLILIICLIPTLSIPIFIGNIFVFLFSKLIPIKTFKEILFFIYITLFLTFGIIIKNLFLYQMSPKASSTINILPFHWEANLINNILINNDFLFLNILYLYLGFFISFLISFILFNTSYTRTLNVLLSFSSSKTINFKPTENIITNFTNFLGITRQEIFFKEYKTFLRNIGQSSQFFLLLGIVFLYFSNLKLVNNFSDFNLNNFVIITTINLGICTFILISFCSRFIFPSLSLEAKAYDIFLKSPISLKLLYNSKKIFWVFFLTIISTTIFTSTSLALNFPPKYIFLNLFLGLIFSYGLTNISLFIGSYFLKLNWKNPYELCASIGSLSCMLVSICYLLFSGFVIYFLYNSIVIENLFIKMSCILSIILILNIILSNILTKLSLNKLKQKILI